MDRRTLGDTDLSVSRVALGTMTFGAQTDEPAAVAMIDECLDRGINLIDTANVYNAGAAEQILGKALKGRRDRVILASKVGGSCRLAGASPFTAEPLGRHTRGHPFMSVRCGGGHGLPHC
jgi:1-deoxyxylulose-5-phosphate synthase